MKYHGFFVFKKIWNLPISNYSVMISCLFYISSKQEHGQNKKAPLKELLCLFLMWAYFYQNNYLEQHQMHSHAYNVCAVIEGHVDSYKPYR